MAERLVDATLRCLARDGYSQLSVENIIAEAGVSRGALFHHFQTKQELVASAMAAFLDRSAKRLTDKLEAMKEEGPGAPVTFGETLRQDAELTLEIAVALRTNESLHASVFRARPGANRDEVDLTCLFKTPLHAEAPGAAALVALLCGASAYNIVASGPAARDLIPASSPAPSEHPSGFDR